VDDSGAGDGAGSEPESEAVGSGLEGAGLDGVAESGADGDALGVGDEEAVLVGVAVGAWLDGAVEVAGCGAGEVFLGLGDGETGDQDGDGEVLVGDGPEVC
jgi:hypothetical protein